MKELTIGPIEKKWREGIAQKGALFIVLLDPDSESKEKVIESGMLAAEAGADVLFMGGSFIGNPHFSAMAEGLKRSTELPVVLFPGGCSHVVPGPDAILFHTLISGRNPQYLIDEQVKGAVLAKSLGIEAIPTGYMLIESGKTTAVEYISNTRPIPADKPAITVAHAIAAEMMGLRWVYLEAGSGAQNAVPAPMVAAVRQTAQVGLIVGGGIREPQAAAERVRAGAQGIVVGNAFEADKRSRLFREFAAAIHQD